MIVNIYYTLAVQAGTVEPPSSVEPKSTKPVSQTQGKLLFVKEVFKRIVMVQLQTVQASVCFVYKLCGILI